MWMVLPDPNKQARRSPPPALHPPPPPAPRSSPAAGGAKGVATWKEASASDGGRGAEQPERGEQGHALPRARFAPQPSRLATLDRQVDAVQGADDTLAGVEIDGQATDVD